MPRPARLPALLLALALTLVAGAGAAPARAADQTEARIAAAVQAGAPATVDWLRALVEQNSGTFNPAGVEAVAALVRPRLEALGFAVRWIPTPETGRAGHLVASHRGDGRGKRLLLIGHLDTVFEPDHPFRGFRIEGGRAIGPGVGDDKGGIAVMVLALQALQQAGALAGADITVVLTGDEEEVGQPVAQARAALVAAGRQADVALDFENLSRVDGRDMGAVARRSSNTWTLRVEGEAAHSSGIFSPAVGAGAGFELARILDAFRRELPEPNLTFNVGLLAAGEQVAFDGPDQARLRASGKDNIVPGVALARGDVRTLSAEQTRRVAAKMQAIVARHLPRTRARLEFAEHYPPMAPTAGNRALLALLNAVNHDLGLPPMGEVDPLARGAGDISFVAPWVDGLVGLGLAGGNSHADGEYVELDSLPRQATRAAVLIHRLARMPRAQPLAAPGSAPGP